MIKWSIILLAALSEQDREKHKKEDEEWYKGELEKEVKKTPTIKQEIKVIEKSYEEMQKELETIRKSAPETPSLSERIQAGTTNLRNIARNAVDNTIGLGIAKVQNMKTKRHFKKNPESKEQIGYLMHGLFQNEGSQWRLAKEMKKKGIHAYHLKGNHSLPRSKSVKKAYQQIKQLHNDTNMKETYKRNDYFSGHSSGADVGVYMAADKKTIQYGIKKIQARAPAPTGLKPVTLGQKILLPFANDDNTNTYHGRKSAVQLSKRNPKIPVQVVAGKFDGLVRPADAAYEQASAHYFINDKASTHFGTSGGHKVMNQIAIGLAGKDEKRYVQEYQEA